MLKAKIHEYFAVKLTLSFNAFTISMNQDQCVQLNRIYLDILKKIAGCDV